MTVEKADLERSLATLRAQIRDPAAGIYGPSSMSWMIDRESAVFLAGGRAALLQLAHPYVAAAIDQHSDTRDDPLGRFRRTFHHVYSMVFGDLDHAVASARRVHAIHSRITGQLAEAVGPFRADSSYEANDEHALFWVQATLIDSAVMAFELVVRPLAAHEKAAYYAEARRFSALFGIPESAMPPSYEAFQAYNRRMWSWLAVSPLAREMAGFLLSSAPALLGPLARWYRMMTAGLLPEPVRAQYDLPFEGREGQLDRGIRRMRALYRRLPPSVRFVPAYHDALRRLEGKPVTRDPVVRLSRRLLAS